MGASEVAPMQNAGGEIASEYSARSGHGANRWRYSAETRNDFTISAST